MTWIIHLNASGSSFPDDSLSSCARRGTQADLLLEETVEDEDEHPLQGVEDGEEVRHHDGGVVEEKQAEGPGQAQQAEEDKRPRHPRPAEHRRR